MSQIEARPTHTLSSPALCVDLDGTLLKSDVFFESLLALTHKRPLDLLRLPAWALKGIAGLKNEIAKRVTLDVTLLPYNTELLDFLKKEKAAGRYLVLVTASNHRIAEEIAKHLGLFDAVRASDRVTNLSGSEKAALLVREFGSRNFDYAANAKRDLEVWKVARQAIPVNAGATVERKARECTEVSRVFPKASASPTLIFRCLRVHQWVKNILIFVPLMLAHHLNNPPVLLKAAIAFFAFSLCASGTYIVNDLFDLDSDRAHPSKRNRPFASGEAPIFAGMILVPILCAGGFFLGMYLNQVYGALLVLYMIATLFYSFRLKQIELVDVVALASLYALRLLGGAIATSVHLSAWLLEFSLFFFLSLALVKRLSELVLISRSGSTQRFGRGYEVGDLFPLVAFGFSSGSISVLVLALYINSPEVRSLYREPYYLWLLCPLLLYWISRILLIAHRGKVGSDPIVFALRDKESYLVGVGVIAVWLLAWLG